MAKKSQRGSTTRPAPRRQQQSSGLWWFITGIVVGVVATKLLMRPPEPRPPAPPSASKTQPAAPAQPIEFKFPKVLSSPEMEVGEAPPAPPARAVPRPPPQPPQTAQPQPVTTPTPLPPAKPAAAASGTGPGGYVVQIASLARAQDAERLKAELALLGISTHVERAVLKNGRTTYRVRTTAFATRAEARQADTALRRHGRKPMILPVR